MQTHVILEFSPTPLQNTPKMELIPRKDYLRQLRTFRDTQLIKVITGVRRCGKTTLMTLFINELKAGGIEDERIVRINFEDYDAIELTDPKALHAYLKSKLQPGKTVYFFLDEIQNVSDFQRVIDSLFPIAKGGAAAVLRPRHTVEREVCRNQDAPDVLRRVC